MKAFFRSLFGLPDDSSTRTVVGGPVSVDAREVQYIKDSNLRVSALHQLYSRYKGTPHEAKLKEVYTKTKDIHVHLVHKKRVHELELFHLQNTDHFLNTFSIILDVHQKHTAPATTATAPLSKATAPATSATAPASSAAAPASKATAPELGSFFKNVKAATAAQAATPQTVAQPLRPPVMQQRQVQQAGSGAPAAALPDVAIDTSSRIRYNCDDSKGIPTTKAIGFTSSPEEKVEFQECMAARLGIYKRDITYIGNAMLALPSAYEAPAHAAFAPILHWRGLTYALSLSDNRLYPVRMYRKSY